jgi:cytidine deaminase
VTAVGKHAGKPSVTSVDSNGRELRERALAAMERAYAPYSKFHVGAVLVGADGSVTEACNVENAAFPAGTCAERAAISSAVAKGVRRFSTIVIASSADEPTPPCGMCRQALIEFAPELEVISVTRSGKEAHWRLSELLPEAFSPSSLPHLTK